MPIIGLTDEITPMLPCMGKLRKGGEKQGGKYGPDLDHFRFTSENHDVLAAYVAAFGDNKQRVLTVALYGDSVDAVFATWCEVWSRTGLQHRCDGKNMSVWLEGDKYRRGSQPCNPKSHEGDDPLNDVVGRLNVIIPELLQAGHVGYVVLETHGKHDILAISRVLHEIVKRGGNLDGFPVTLRRVQREISTPGFGDRAGQRSRVKKWLVEIEPIRQWMDSQLLTARSAAIGELPPPRVIDNETGEIITEAPQLPAPQQSPPPAPEMEYVKPAPSTRGFTVANLGSATTGKGTPITSLTDDQLTTIMSSSNVKAETLEAAALESAVRRAKAIGLTINAGWTRPDVEAAIQAALHDAAEATEA